jgi:hypothetical protein
MTPVRIRLILVHSSVDLARVARPLCTTRPRARVAHRMPRLAPSIAAIFKVRAVNDLCAQWH